MPPHDVLILGTSPVLLIEGLVRSRAGQSVRFLDGAADFGGAWANTSLEEIGDVEAACHLLENYSGVYRFLSQEIGLELEVCDPPPLAMHSDGSVRDYNGRWRHLARLARVLARLPIVAVIRGLEWCTGGRILVRRTANFRIREAVQKIEILGRHEKGTAIRYFAGGSPGMLRHLRAELEGRGARFLTGKVASLEVGDDLVRATTAGGDTYEAEEVVVSESLSIPGLWVDGTRHAFREAVTHYRHVVAEVAGASGRLCSYVHLHEDPTVARISDVTGFCTAVPEGSRVVVVQLRGDAEGTEAERVERAFQHLRARGAVPAALRVLRFRVTEMPIASCEPAAAPVLEGIGHPRVTVLPSRGDLALSFAHNQVRWQAWLDRGRDPELVPGPLIALPVR